MKKKIIVTMIVLVSFLAGCSLIPQFEQAKEEYLETRVAELLEEQPAEEQVVEEPVVEEEELAAEGEDKSLEETAAAEEEVVAEPEVEETEEAEEVIEADEIPEETEVPEEETEPEPEPTIKSDDPGIYLGDPDWIDEMETTEY